jgi:hypothetical protein
MRFCTGVDFRMLLYVGTLATLFSTQVTFMGFLCSVSSVMLNKVCSVTEGFPADITLIRLLL